MIRLADTEADLGRCVEIFNAVDPEHPVGVDDLRSARGVLLLHEGGGYVYVAESSVTGHAYTMIRVRPEARGRGVGSALLAAADEKAREMGKGGIWGRVDPDDGRSRAWLAARGFTEGLQEVELLRRVEAGDGEVADGIELMREEHLAGAYAVDAECLPDIPSMLPLSAPPFERWRDEIARRAATFVALDGDRVVGYATMERLHGTPERLEHGLTGVLRSHRGRGLATKLKRAQIRWAADNGFRELITFTDTTNAAMRRVNVKLGYAETLGAISVSRDL